MMSLRSRLRALIHRIRGPLDPPPVAEMPPEVQQELTERMQDADRRAAEVAAQWPKVSGQSLRLARLNRENRFSGMIDRALGSGPS